MAHPYAGQAQASQKRRLGALGAKAGKPHGSSNMYKKTSYPKKGAGSSTPMTISGGKGRSRPDRFAAGGATGGKRKGKSTTNIIIAGGGGQQGARPVPVPVRRPVPVPVPARPAMAGPPVGGPPIGPPPGALPIRPPIARPAGPPMGGPPPMPGMKAGGVVKKAAGGKVGGYSGFPFSPTREVDSATSARKKGGATYKKGGAVKLQVGGGLGGLGGPKKKDDEDDDDDDEDGGGGDYAAEALGGADLSTGPPPAGPPPGFGETPPPTPPPTEEKRGGAVKKRQRGGGFLSPRPGVMVPTPPQKGAPTISGARARPGTPLMVPVRSAAGLRAQPAPGTTVGFKKGGASKHSDEAQDKKLIKKMLKEEKRK